MAGFDFGGFLSALGPGLMAAGSGGWDKFAPGFMQGQQIYDDRQQRKLTMEETRKLRELQQQQLQMQIEQQRTANQDAVAKKQAMEKLLGGGLMAPNGMSQAQFGGAPTQPGLMSGQFQPEQLQFLQALGPDAAPILADQLFKTPEQQKGISIGGVLVNPITGEKIADFSDVVRQNAAAGRSVTNVNMPPMEKEYQKAFGAGLGKSALAITEQADTSRKQLDAINTIKSLRSAAQSAGGDVGALAPIQAQVGSLLQAAGLNPQDYNLGPTGIYQAIDAAANKLALSGIGEGGLPANNFSEADRNFIVSTVPSLGNTPEAFELKALVVERANARNIEKEQLWNSGKYDQTSEEGYRQFERDWTNYVRSNPLFKPDEIQAIQAAKSQMGKVKPDQGFKQPGQVDYLNTYGLTPKAP